MTRVSCYYNVELNNARSIQKVDRRGILRVSAVVRRAPRRRFVDIGDSAGMRHFLPPAEREGVRNGPRKQIHLSNGTKLDFPRASTV